MPRFYPAEVPVHASVQAADYQSRYKPSSYSDALQYGATFTDYRNAGNHDLGATSAFPYNRFESQGLPQPTSLRSSKGYSAAGYPVTQPDSLPPISAPMIPPLRVDERHLPDQSAFAYNQQQAYNVQYEAQPKEEKVVGGVSATLDYDMEQMTCFVAETTVGMYALYTSDIYILDIDLLRSIKPGSAEPQGFRKWVLQVLSATRLPSATILLSLSYMALRVRQQYAAGSLTTSERGLYKILTVALILGSKFLDDNTFQNKSWAEVSHIGVVDLNQDERDWLSGFGHRLHYDPGCADGFESCQELWNSFKRRASTPAVLRPLDTNVRRQRSMNQLSAQGSSSHYGKSPVSGFSTDSRYSERQLSTPAIGGYDQWFGHRSNINGSPPTAPHSGPTTPEYYPGQGLWAAGNMDKYPQQAPYGYPIPHFNPQPATYNSGWNTPNFPSNAFWNCHGAACQCAGCRQGQLSAPRYGPIVVG